MLRPPISVDEIETLLVDVPTIRPHHLAMTTMNGQTLAIVRIRTTDGIDGFGEATTIGGLAYGSESPEGVKLAIDTYIASHLRAADATNVAATMVRIGKAVQGNLFAKCAVETALLDALGKRHGVPVSTLLGGRVRDRLPVAWTLASGDSQRDIAEAEEMLSARRHAIFKVKIGRGEARRNIDHVAAIKRAVGDRASVRVDVNQAWSETTAARALPMLEGAGIDLVEQPIAAANRRGMARLSAKAAVPIMADESLSGPEAAFDLATIAAADVFSIKIAPSGGLLAAAKVAAVGEAAGIGLYGGTMLEGPVGTAASAQLCAALSQLDWGTELFGPRLLAEELLTEPLEYADFGLKVPEGPGLGVTLDEDKLAHFRRDRPGRSVHTVVPLKTRS